MDLQVEDPIKAVAVEIDSKGVYYRKTSSEFLLKSLAIEAEDGIEVILGKNDFSNHQAYATKYKYGQLGGNEQESKCVKVEQVRFAEMIGETQAAKTCNYFQVRCIGRI